MTDEKRKTASDKIAAAIEAVRAVADGVRTVKGALIALASAASAALAAGVAYLEARGDGALTTVKELALELISAVGG